MSGVLKPSWRIPKLTGCLNEQFITEDFFHGIFQQITFDDTFDGNFLGVIFNVSGPLF